MLACLMTSDQTPTTTATTTSRPYSLRLAHRPALLTRANPVPVSCKVLPIIHAPRNPLLGARFQQASLATRTARAFSAGASHEPGCDAQRETTGIKADPFSISSSGLPFKSKPFRLSRRLKSCHHCSLARVFLVTTNPKIRPTSHHTISKRNFQTPIVGQQCADFIPSDKPDCLRVRIQACTSEMAPPSGMPRPFAPLVPVPPVRLR